MKHCFKIHLILSLFFLPLLVAYAITGGMYMAGAPGDLGDNVTQVQLHLPKAPTTPEEATAELRAAGFDTPEGQEWRKAKNGNLVLGNSAGRHFQLTTDGKLNLIEPGLYPQMLLIHKGKAGLWFTILGYGAAASMLLLYLSGLAIVWRNKRQRPLMLVSLVLGCGAVVGGLLML